MPIPLEEGVGRAKSRDDLVVEQVGMAIVAGL